MVVVYGRRRIGKTTLINKFIETKKEKCISFVVVERKENELLAQMSNTVLTSLAPELLGSVSFDSFEKIFDFIAKSARKERVILFIDEYPYLAKECPYIHSILQKYADNDFKQSKLFLILCGSLVSFMKEEVLSVNAPLYGRSTLVLKLNPLSYKQTALFVPNYTDEEKAIVFGLSNGVPKYIEQFNPEKSLNSNIEELFFSNTGYFTEDQIKTIISPDRQYPSIFNSIINAIAQGYTKYNEIASFLKMKDINYYLKTLCNAEVIEKRMSSKKPYYILSDTMLTFWFKYVSPAYSAINAGKGKLAYAQGAKQHMHEYMGKVFEKMAKQYIFQNMGSQILPVYLEEIGNYQTSFKNKSGVIQQIEIDLYGTVGNRCVLAGECKFTNEKFSKEALDAFKNKVSVLQSNPQLILFSMYGFDAYVKKHAGNILLIDGKTMYKKTA